MLTFILAVFVLVATPGPALLSILGIGSAFGFKVGLSYAAGVVVGANIVCLMAVSGLVTLLTAFPTLHLLSKIISGCYLFYLAYRIATSNPELQTTDHIPRIGFLDGIIIQFFNPKAYAVALALFSGFPLYEQSFILESALKFLIINMIWIPAHLAWLYIGLTLNNVKLNPEKKRILNLIFAAMMISAVTFSVFI
jgi:threonine/homoserine/homoserine lactone efflux protein